MIKSVFIIEHSYELDGCDEAKLIGAFSILEKAEDIVEQYKKLPGFNLHQDGFFINEYKLDEAEWSEGFLTCK